jgi:nitroreductase / dihydropteridine reductase
MYMQQTLNQALAWRYATNQFDVTKKVSEENLTSILESANLMPTAYGLQPFRLIVIADQAVKDSLVEHAYGQKHIAENSHLIVLAARTDIDEAMIAEYTARIEAIRNLPAGTTDGFKGMMVGSLTTLSAEARLVWAQKQSYLALGAMIAAASELDIDNHALEGFNPAAFNEMLGLTDLNLTATTLLALGYRDEADASQHYAKVRLPLDTLVIKK